MEKLKKPLMYINVGLEFGFAIAIGIFIGYFLDGKFGTKPYLTFIFFLLGVAAAIKNLITNLKILERMFGDNSKKD